MAKTVNRRKISVPQYAQELGVSQVKVLHFIRSGQLTAMNSASDLRNRPRYLIDRQDADAFEKSREVTPDGGISTTQRLRRKAAADVKEFV